ncbi:MAG: hypothetical protein H7125_06100 [Proteobacteria bacterium]|nr:hypothetical protein [Burkholderiales bacterium]
MKRVADAGEPGPWPASRPSRSRTVTPGVAPLWQRAPRFAVVHIVAVIAGGLALDAAFGWPGQHAATLWACAVWAYLYRAGGAAERRSLILCMLIAGAGEIGLSLVWGVYDYRFGNLPLFVPPGHALLMTLGVIIAARVPLHATVRGVTLLAAVWALWAWVGDADRFGALLFLLFAGCLAFGRDRALYSVMFVLALAMELYGTALGSWTWRPEVPGLALSAANPPFAAGAFYAMLDLLVLAALAARWPATLPVAAPVRSE